VQRNALILGTGPRDILEDAENIDRVTFYAIGFINYKGSLIGGIE
jgi:hypothetical protein